MLSLNNIISRSYNEPASPPHFTYQEDNSDLPSRCQGKRTGIVEDDENAVRSTAGRGLGGRNLEAYATFSHEMAEIKTKSDY